MRPRFDSWVGKMPWRRDRLPTPVFLGFPCGSDGKESACNAGDTSSIPGLGRCPGEGIGYPPQHSWASLVAQMVKNPPAMQETWVQSLGWEDSPGGEHGNLPQYSCLENLMDSAQRATAHRVAQLCARLWGWRDFYKRPRPGTRSPLHLSVVNALST